MPRPTWPASCKGTLYITPGSPWENGYCESFNGSLRDELLNGEISYTLAEASILIEGWRWHYNTVRPHRSLGYRPPAPETAMPPLPPSASASLHLRTAMAPEATLHQQSNRTTQEGRSLDAVRMPVAIIAAEHDSIIPPARTEALRGTVPHLVFARTIAGAGHNDIYQDPLFHAAMHDALSHVLAP